MDSGQSLDPLTVSTILENQSAMAEDIHQIAEIQSAMAKDLEELTELSNTVPYIGDLTESANVGLLSVIMILGILVGIGFVSFLKKK